MKISKVIFHIKPIPSHPWWECKKVSEQSVIFFKNDQATLNDVNSKSQVDKIDMVEFGYHG